VFPKNANNSTENKTSYTIPATHQTRSLEAQPNIQQTAAQEIPGHYYSPSADIFDTQRQKRTLLACVFTRAQQRPRRHKPRRGHLT